MNRHDCRTFSRRAGAGLICVVVAAALLSIVSLSAHAARRPATQPSSEEMFKKKVAEQKEQNKEWEDEAKATQKGYVELAKSRLKEDRGREAEVLFRQALTIYYDQWPIRKIKRAMHAKRQPADFEAPAQRKTRVRLKTSLNDTAEAELQKLSEKDQAGSVEEAYKQADKLAADKHKADAYQVYQRLATADLPYVLAKKFSQPAAVKARKILDETAKALEQIVAAADAKKDGKDLLAMIDAFMDEFGGLESREDLQAGFVAATQHSRVAAARREQEARDLLEGGRADEKDGELADAFDAYELVAQQYLDTPAGKDAADELHRFNENKVLLQAMRDKRAGKDCQRKMTFARNYAASGLLDRATALYNEVIEQYPDTSYAEAAAKALAEITAAEATKHRAMSGAADTDAAVAPMKRGTDSDAATAIR